jgi:hypothetical protein
MSDEPVVPRTRDNRMRRKGRTDPRWEEGELTCPRCGWPARYLIKPYHESVWTVYGGMCGWCCQQAATHHDKTAWPPPAVEGAIGTVVWPGNEW